MYLSEQLFLLLLSMVCHFRFYMVYSKCDIAMVVNRRAICRTKVSLVLDLGWNLQDLSFQTFRASLYTTFLENCISVYRLRTTTTYLRIVVGCEQGQCPCEIILLQQISLCQLRFIDVI